MRRLISILIIIQIFSCKRNNDNENVKKSDFNKQIFLKKDNGKEVSNFNLERFTTIPKEIDGCGCYFYLTKEDQVNDKLIFVNDFANIAFVSIGGQLIKFELKDHEENSDLYLYSNGLYNLKILIVKKEDGGDEESIIEGFINISNSKFSVEKKFIGTCGC